MNVLQKHVNSVYKYFSNISFSACICFILFCYISKRLVHKMVLIVRKWCLNEHFVLLLSRGICLSKSLDLQMNFRISRKTQKTVYQVPPVYPDQTLQIATINQPLYCFHIHTFTLHAHTLAHTRKTQCMSVIISVRLVSSACSL